MLPLFNYANGDHEAIREQLLHPSAVLGLGDGGAHCGMICDASLPTYSLTHWARDRSRGEKLPLEWLVQDADPGHGRAVRPDRPGRVEPGHAGRPQRHRPRGPHPALAPPGATTCPPAAAASSRRPTATSLTIVNGVVTRRDGVDTGARPGRLVRSGS